MLLFSNRFDPIATAIVGSSGARGMVKPGGAWPKMARRAPYCRLPGHRSNPGRLAVSMSGRPAQ
jgi:hypothetical protein